MSHSFLSLIFSVCSIFSFSSCATLEDSYSVNVSKPLSGQMLGAKIEYLDEKIIKASIGLDININDLPIGKSYSNNQYLSEYVNLLLLLKNDETLNPQYSFLGLKEASKNYQEALQNNDKAKIAEIEKLYLDKNGKKDLNERIMLTMKLAYLAAILNQTITSELYRKNASALSIIAQDSIDPNVNVDKIYKNSLISQLNHNYAESNIYLDTSEDFADESRYGAKLDPNVLLLLKLNNMYRGINNYFLGNYSAAVSAFMSADEYEDQSDDYYIYNKLNMYFAIAKINWYEAREFLKRVQSNITNDKLKETWAFRILQAINDSDPKSLFNQVDEFAKDDKDRSEILCETYYYLGMEFYLRDQVDIAKIFFTLSKNLNITYFIENTTSSMALRTFYQEYENSQQN